jgi:hypothetical protein
MEIAHCDTDTSAMPRLAQNVSAVGQRMRDRWSRRGSGPSNRRAVYGLIVTGENEGKGKKNEGAMAALDGLMHETETGDSLAKPRLDSSDPRHQMLQPGLRRSS